MNTRLIQLLAAALPAGALLAACASAPPAAVPNPQALTPTEQYAVQVEPVVDEILLAPHGHLSAAQAGALGELVMRWRELGDGPITVQSAAAGPAQDTGAAVVQALQGLGVPAAAVQLSQAAAVDPAAPAQPVRVGFGRLAAVGPHCASQWGELTRTRENLPYAAFGCATTANFAAQIADPRDLTRPRASGAADGDRRAEVLGKYRKGEPTGVQRNDDERGVVSRKIQ